MTVKTITCRNCGGNMELTEGVNKIFCLYCGTENLLTDVMEIPGVGLSCLSCSARNKHNSIFCSKCGVKLQKECLFCNGVHTYDTVYCPETGRNINLNTHEPELYTKSEIKKARENNMAKIYGYGKDALTFLAFNNYLKSTLKKNLKDNSNPKDCVIFFHPGFGRSDGENSSQFGKFDTILISQEYIYLIESKWDGRKNSNKEYITLEDKQILQYKAFLHYYNIFRGQKEFKWDEIYNHKDDFYDNFNKTLPSEKTILAQNLKFVFNKIYELKINCKDKELKNILLYFYDQTRSKPILSKNKLFNNSIKFEIVNYDYSELLDGNFIILGPVAASVLTTAT
ncbi:MAG: hypothetical protein ABRQ37_06035 [Candidatus Eremiobacterota bacterium]